MIEILFNNAANAAAIDEFISNLKKEIDDANIKIVMIKEKRKSVLISYNNIIINENDLLPYERLLLLLERIERIRIKEENSSTVTNEIDRKVKGSLLLKMSLKSELVLHAEILHDEKERDKMWRKCVENAKNIIGISSSSSSSSSYASSLFMFGDDIRKYFGDQVAFYFAWMSVYTLSLLPPAILGYLLYEYFHTRESVNRSKSMPFFSLFMAIYGLLFQKYWLRYASTLAHQWGTFDIGNEEILERPRLAFTSGVREKNPVTQELEPYFPSYRRYPRYLLSFLVSSLMLMIALGVMILSLNFQGYIRNSESIFFIHQLAVYSTAGAIFDPSSDSMYTLIPTIVHAATIFVLNQTYKLVAIKLTNYENHRTDTAYYNHLVFKRFCFEFLDCYLPLFYIAFYALNMKHLRQELIALFVIDEVRRVSMEVIIPFVTQKLLTKIHSNHSQHSKNVNDNKKEEKKEKEKEEEDDEKEEYDQFDDFLEMTIQYGYIYLFASAFPLAAGYALIANVIEICSDLFKITWLCKRPRPRKAANIGIWAGILQTMSFAAIITNTFIFGVTSEQIDTLLPFLPESDHLTAVFVVEHIVILLALFLWLAISNVPQSIRYERLRQALFLKQKLSGSDSPVTVLDRLTVEIENEKKLKKH